MFVIGFCVKTSESLTLGSNSLYSIVNQELTSIDAESSVGNPYVFAATGHVGLAR